MRKNIKKIFAVITLLVLLSLIFLTVSGCQAEEKQETERSAGEEPEEKNLETYEEDFSAIEEALDYID